MYFKCIQSYLKKIKGQQKGKTWLLNGQEHNYICAAFYRLREQIWVGYERLKLDRHKEEQITSSEGPWDGRRGSHGDHSSHEELLPTLARQRTRRSIPAWVCSAFDGQLSLFRGSGHSSPCRGPCGHLCRRRRRPAK